MAYIKGKNFAYLWITPLEKAELGELSTFCLHIKVVVFFLENFFILFFFNFCVFLNKRIKRG
jgi:hypothetical protein